ncbi:MAG: hypothetical protein V7L21_18730 [Nostoc sp.]|nr:hypothetical protein [Nostoc sp. NMS9]MBN3942470.1 hypothetical protein [Nostoc sp. NMS9]
MQNTFALGILVLSRSTSEKTRKSTHNQLIPKLLMMVMIFVSMLGLIQPVKLNFCQRLIAYELL